MTSPIHPAGIDLIKRYEGCRLTAYADPGGIWTIGWGHTKGVSPGDRITQQEADRLLEEDIRIHAAEVAQVLDIEPTAHQFAALTSFAYNCRGWRKASVITAHNRGDFASAARAFSLWNKARDGSGNLVVLNGLVARRASEAALYLTPSTGEASGMTYAEPPAPLSRSREIAGAAAAAVPVTLPALVETAKQVGALKQAATDIGTWMPYITLLALVALGFVIWARWTRRREGSS